MNFPKFHANMTKLADELPDWITVMWREKPSDPIVGWGDELPVEATMIVATGETSHAAVTMEVDPRRGDVWNPGDSLRFAQEVISDLWDSLGEMVLPIAPDIKPPWEPTDG